MHIFRASLKLHARNISISCKRCDVCVCVCVIGNGVCVWHCDGRMGVFVSVSDFSAVHIRTWNDH